MAIRLGSLALRLVLPAALIAMTAAAAAGPAAAAEPPQIRLAALDRIVTVDGGSKTAQIAVTNAGTSPVTGLLLAFGTAGAPIDPRIGFRPPAGCTATGCAVGDLASYARKAYAFTVEPTAELPAGGAAFTVSVHDAGGRWRESATVTVVPRGQGIDIGVVSIPDITLAAGGSAPLPIVIVNKGTRPTEDGFAVELVGEAVLAFREDYSNCVPGPETGVVCVFDQALAPGASYTVASSTPLTVSVDRTLAGPAEHHGAVYAFGLAAAPDAAKKALGRPGPTVRLVPAVRSLDVEPQDPSELNAWDNVTSIVVKVARNPADSVAVGGTFAGAIGDTRTIKVGFRNDGPADVLRPARGWTQSARVRIPSGLRLTAVDRGCVPSADGEPNGDHPGRISGHDYVCVATSALAAGEQQLFSFTAEIQDGRNEEEGSITVDGGVQEARTTNNTAVVEVEVTAGGGAGGGLPVTGTPVVPVAATGLLLVLAGGAMVLPARRRRIG